jgi:hypothetical protein
MNHKDLFPDITDHGEACHAVANHDWWLTPGPYPDELD